MRWGCCHGDGPATEDLTMYVITMTAPTRTLFIKEVTLRLAKERVIDEFHRNPDFDHASIYDQFTRCEIERTRGLDWKKVTK